MKSQKFNSIETFLNAGEFSHLNLTELKNYDYIEWFKDGTIYGAKNNLMHFIDDGCGEPNEDCLPYVWIRISSI